MSERSVAQELEKLAAAPAAPPFDPATATVQTRQGFVLSPELQKNRATYRNNKAVQKQHKAQMYRSRAGKNSRYKDHYDPCEFSNRSSSDSSR